MNKTNILAVMSLGLFFSVPMYAPPQDPTLSAQQEGLPKGALPQDPTLSAQQEGLPKSALPQDPTLSAQQEGVPAESVVIPTLEELKESIKKEQERKVALEKQISEILEEYKNKLDQTVKSVAEAQTALLKNTIQQETNKEIDRMAAELSKKPFFRNNLEKLSEQALENDPLAFRIARKAAANVEEHNAKLSERLQKLEL